MNYNIVRASLLKYKCILFCPLCLFSRRRQTRKLLCAAHLHANQKSVIVWKISGKCTYIQYRINMIILQQVPGYRWSRPHKHFHIWSSTVSDVGFSLSDEQCLWGTQYNLRMFVTYRFIPAYSMKLFGLHRDIVSLWMIQQWLISSESWVIPLI